MGVEFTKVPQPYDAVHFGILAFIAAVCAALFFVFRRLDEKKLIRIISILGAAMIACEIWKQFFVIKYVYNGVRSTWFFPWQLCSMAMYCSFALPFLKGRAQNAVLVFLSSFSLLAALMALAVPDDMMRPQILLFCHSFLYHGIMVVESIAAMLILSRRKKAPFGPAVLLFLAMAAVAELINVISHRIIGDTHVEANMFYITPYYPSTQPVFHEIAVKWGVWAEILLYLGAIILASWGIYGIFLAIAAKSRRKEEIADR